MPDPTREEILAVLEPFARFQSKLDAKPIRGLDPTEMYSIHGGDGPLTPSGATIRWPDISAAAALHARLSQPAADECEIPPAGWRCTRTAGHEGPCAAIEDDYVAWLRYSRSSSGNWPTRIIVCDSDAPGAFKVYRGRSK